MTPAPRPGRRQVRVASPQSERLCALLRRHGFTARRVDAHGLQVEDTTPEEVGRLAHFFHVPLHHLSAVEQCAEHATSR